MNLHPYIYKENGICEVTIHDLTNEASIADNNPRIKTGGEIISILNQDHKNVLTRHNMI